MFSNFDFNNDNKKSFVISLGIFDELDIKVTFWEMDLGIFPLLFSKKSLANKDFPTPFYQQCDWSDQDRNLNHNCQLVVCF